MKENSSKKKISRADIILYLVLLLLTVGILLWYGLLPKAGNLVEVRVSGEIIGTYALQEDRTITIEGKNGGKNILVIQNGKASMREADCPDKVCVKKGEINRVSESIICLPHEVVVEIKKGDTDHQEDVSGSKEDDVDVIAK